LPALGNVTLDEVAAFLEKRVAADAVTRRAQDEDATGLERYLPFVDTDEIRLVRCESPVHVGGTRASE
jgi:hypothetical protein